MMRRALLLLALAFAGIQPADAAQLTSTAAGGNLSSGSTWVGGVAPNCTNDDVVIATTGGNVVTGDVSCVLGAAGAASTNAITVNSGARFNIVAPTTIRGRVTLTRGATPGTLEVNNAGANTGNLVFFPTASAVYDMVVAGSSGTAAFYLTGESQTDRVLVSTNLSSNASGWFYFNFTATDAPWLNFDDATISECGDSGNSSTTRCLSYASGSGSSVTMDYVQWVNVGKLYFDYSGRNNVTFDVRNSDWRGPRSSSDWLQVIADTDLVSGTRQLKDCTFYHTAARTLFMTSARDFTVDGGVYVNAKLQFDNGPARITVQNVASFHTVAFFGGIISAETENTIVIQDSLLGADGVSNPHYLAFTSGTDRGTATIIRRNVCDGFGYVGADAGDFTLPDEATTLDRNLLINRCGTAVSILNDTTELTATRNTIVGPGTHFNVNENGFGGPNTLVRVSSNLLVGQDTGLMMDGTPSAQTVFNLDYNGFYNQTQLGNLDHPTANGGASVNSYLKAGGSWWSAGTYGLNDNKGLHDRYGDPGFVNSSATLVSWYNANLGSGGSSTTVIAEMVKLNGTATDGSSTTFNTSFTTAAGMAYLRAAFTPTNTAAYDGTGDPDDGSPDIGAIDLAAASGGTVGMRSKQRRRGEF